MSDAPPKDPQKRQQELEQLVSEVEAGRLDAEIVERYVERATAMVGDDSPMSLDLRRRSELTEVLGRDPGDIKIHTGERAQAVAEAMEAKAFALGTRHIFLGSDAARKLDAPEGKAVLAHEVTHTMQAEVGLGFSRPGTPARNLAESEAREVEARVLARESKPIRNQPAEGDELDPTGAQAKGVIDPMELHRQLPDHVKDMVTRRVMALLDDRGRFEAERLGLPHGD